jgi:uncharacterized repeat protein (TIGR03847 family)
MSPPFDFVCEHFTAGTVGPPGQRVFYLQAGAAGSVVTLRCEKQQVGALGEHLDRILSSLPPGPAGGGAIPAELIDPVEPAWIVGALALGYDEDADRLVIQIAELTEEDAEPGATARWEVRRDQARAFIARSTALLQGGRPPCPLCQRPLDPEGHTCIKTNGHLPH